VSDFWFRTIFAIAMLGAMLSEGCSARHPVDCDSGCVAEAKTWALQGADKRFRDVTEEQWQSAFASAEDDLAKGDWSQRLSDIKQEFCKTPGKVDSVKVRALENDMLTKLLLETRDKHIDVMAAYTHPDDASGIRAIKRMRSESVKQSILKVGVERIMQSCYVPASPSNAATAN
jgi:hypothetical protein